MDDNGERFVFGVWFFFFSQRHHRRSFLRLGTVFLQVSPGFFPDTVVPLTLLLLLFFSFCFFFVFFLHLNENVGVERDTAVPSGRRLKEIKNNRGNMSLCLSQGWSKWHTLCGFSPFFGLMFEPRDSFRSQNEFPFHWMSLSVQCAGRSKGLFFLPAPGEEQSLNTTQENTIAPFPPQEPFSFTRDFGKTLARFHRNYPGKTPTFP